MLSKQNILISLSATYVAQAQCPFGLDSQSNDKVSNQTLVKKVPKVKQSDITYPSDIFTCSSGSGTTTSSNFNEKVYEDVVDKILHLYESIDDTVSDNFNPRANFAGCLIRTAGHDFMDFRMDTGLGGSDGCINFNDADNTGLADCLVDSGLTSVYDEVCDQVSLADFFVIAGEAVMGRTATSYRSVRYYAQDTLAYALKNNFKAGRVTQLTCDWNQGLMPNADTGCEDLQTVFVDNVFANTGLEWELTAAISGAHTIGSAKPQNSGYDGFWSESEQQGLFNNDYYISLIAKGWAPDTAVHGNEDKNQFIRADRGADDNHQEIMLSSDMCLAFERNEQTPPDRGGRGDDDDDDEDGDDDGGKDDGGKDGGKGGKDGGGKTEAARGRRRRLQTTNFDNLLAQDGHCCGWVQQDFLFDNDIYFGGEPYCGTTADNGGNGNRAQCCDGDFDFDCDMVRSPGGPAIDSIIEFMKDENVWLNSYMTSWDIATTNGYRSRDLWAIGSGSSTMRPSMMGEDSAIFYQGVLAASSSIIMLLI